MKITYKKGDATLHKNGVIVHCVNDINVMGAGIAQAIAQRWPNVKKEYTQWGNQGFYLDDYSSTKTKKIPFQLGYIQLVKVDHTLHVCNLIGQRDIKPFHDIPPIRYQSLMEGLYRLKDQMEFAKIHSLATGRIGAGLAGGKWNVIEQIIKKVFDKSEISVTIYDIENWEGTIYE